MKKVTYVERSGEERNKVSNLIAMAMIFAILCALGFVFLVDSLEASTTCNGTTACLVRTVGTIFLPLIGIYLSWYVLSGIFYLTNKWKQVDPKEEKSNTKKK